jgi:hypothetical protein
MGWAQDDGGDDGDGDDDDSCDDTLGRLVVNGHGGVD